MLKSTVCAAAERKPMSLYEELRAKHPLFVYEDYTLGEDYLEFHFVMDEYEFRPRWTFDRALWGAQCDRGLTERCAFSLGMAELVSYWKCALSPRIEVRCGGLTPWQREWWKKLYMNGLGEFFYRNGLNPDPAMFTLEAPEQAPLAGKSAPKSGVLVPIGGGKDSVVTVELLKSAGEDIFPYIINPRPATLGCVEAAGIAPERTVGVRRTIDKTLLDLNAKGYFNGHTPFSAVVAFSAELFACMTGRRYIALSNESSANEAYVEGTAINHQYSKSTEFERDFREYCERSFCGGGAEYFSLLRPWSEWQIAREFVRHPQYFGVFQSCNLGSKTNVWCGKCAKCLYVYILLAAFLDDETLHGIFGCDMLQKEELSEMLDGLMLDGEDKPFECVGTKAEVRLSLYMAAQRREGRLPALLRRFRGKLGGYVPDGGMESFFDKDNFVPQQFLPLLKGECSNEH